VSREQRSPVDVVAVGLGAIGLGLSRRVLAQARFRLVAAVDADPAKAGRPLDELLESTMAANGLRVGAGINALPPGEPSSVALLSTVSRVEDIAPQVVALVSAGYNVLTTCEELSYPWESREASLEIEAAAVAGGRSVVATGINPGFLLDTLPRALTAACVSVDRVGVHRFVDLGHRRTALQQKVGVGLSPAEFRDLADAGKLGHVGLRHSALLLAEGMGWTLDTFEEELKPAIAESDVDSALGPIREGSVIGQHQTGQGRIGGREVVFFRLDMYLGAESKDEIVIEGTPPVHQVIHGGVNGDVGTEAMVTNLIPLVASARPGLLTMTHLMPLGWRSSHALSNGG
jgi:2,4-diaminopentanoate dehydrogenase